VALSEAGLRLPERAVPRRRDAWLFALKVQVFRVERTLSEIGRAPKRLARGDAAAFGTVVAEQRTPLWSDPRSGERAMQWGKVQNLRAAARRLDSTVLPEGAVFSFWRQLGRASRAKGFVDGRMLQEGCLVPAVGGGLCQLSNALHAVALDAGCAIVERHAHSRIVPGSRAEAGRDATVAWNYVDLRFAAPQPMMLRVTVEQDALVVQLRSPPVKGEVERSRSDLSDGVDNAVPPPDALRAPTSPQGGGESCGTCDQTSCFRHEGGRAAPAGRTAFLVDENWPELRAFVARERGEGDLLALPLDGARWRLARYRWETDGFARVTPATAAALWQSFKLRRAKDGPQRRQAEIARAKALAARMARTLTPDATQVVVAQSLLPHLWRDSHLGGRRFKVLMTRLPMAEIEAWLDAAAARHPERLSLSDFRADPALVAAEAEALAAAEAIVTPHAAVATLFGERAVRLEWQMPKPLARNGEIVARRIAFPGPTAARKGAFELRAAAKALDLEIVLVGSELEGADFWSGVRTRRADPSNWLDGVAAVIQPALVEDAPRRLLQALASGVPVIATPACGLPAQAGLTLVPGSDSEASIAALLRIVSAP
jgi:VanW like protein/Glycosyl transferases group 1